MIALATFLVFLAVFFGVRALLPAPDPGQRLAARLAPERAGMLRLDRREDMSSLPLVNRLLLGFSPLQGLRIWVRQAGLSISPAVPVLTALLLGSGSFFLVNLLAHGTAPAWAAGTFAASLPFAFLHRRRAKRIKIFSSAFPDAVSRLASSLRAGYSLQMAIEALVEDAGSLISEEFRIVLSEIEVGQSFETALKRMLERIDTPDLRLFIASVLIQRESGGNLAEVLDNLETTIQERFALQRELAAATAQAKLSGIVLSLLPVFVGLSVYFINRDYMLFFVNDPVGQALFKGCIAGQVMGMLTIRKIVGIQL